MSSGSGQSTHGNIGTCQVANHGPQPFWNLQPAILI